MDSKSPNLYPSLPNRLLPRTVIAAAASALLLTSCTEKQGTPTVTETVTATASPSSEASAGDNTAASGHGEHASATPTMRSTESDHQEQPHHTPSHAVSPEPTKHKPTPSATPKPSELEFYVTGDCQKDGELDNWSKNFTPYGSTRNLIMQPDGTAYEGLLNDGYGNIDGLGHSQWHWLCEAGDQKGEYTGQIIDLGKDNTYGTGDDRKIAYTFEVN